MQEQGNGTDTAAVKIPAGTVTFETESGAKFAVPVISFSRELEKLADTVREAGRSHEDYLEEIVAIIRTQHGAEITIEEADWFKDQLGVERAKKKQRQAAKIADELNSVYSMASTVSAAGASASGS